ncbi:hypothetical protein ATANTOWER_020696 [Ataeniobius toweri]|uniref:Uncharacterized protein n=1 Tax=Ataeniobius toweri TaxID=208326 RepID=A0ABU7BAC6_9TELE|nr:hypothetical protein [Ataeniobius toweri]
MPPYLSCVSGPASSGTRFFVSELFLLSFLLIYTLHITAGSLCHGSQEKFTTVPRVQNGSEERNICVDSHGTVDVPSNCLNELDPDGEHELRTKCSSQLSVTPSTRRSLMKRKRKVIHTLLYPSMLIEVFPPTRGFDRGQRLPILHSRPLTLLITPPARALIGCVEVFTREGRPAASGVSVRKEPGPADVSPNLLQVLSDNLSCGFILTFHLLAALATNLA